MQDCKSYLAIAKDVVFWRPDKTMSFACPSFCKLLDQFQAILTQSLLRRWREFQVSSNEGPRLFSHMQCREIMTILNQSVFIIRAILQVDYCLKMVFVWAIWHMGLLLYKHCFSHPFQIKKITLFPQSNIINVVWNGSFKITWSTYVCKKPRLDRLTPSKTIN